MMRNLHLVLNTFKNTLQLCTLVVFFAGCGKETPMRLIASNSEEATFSSIFENSNSGAGGGANVQGVGSFSVPTREAIIARIEIGLQNNVKPSAGNFARALTQVKSNLPKQTDPTKVTGFDQVQLLVYGACSDLTTGTTPSMLSKYQVDPKIGIAANQAALITAGVKMLDQHVAGLASASSATEAIKTALTTLVTDLIAAPANTSTIAFMAVCIAANTSGSSLMGF